MRKLFFSLLGSLCIYGAEAQNPATVFTIANRNVLLPCGTNCLTITAQVPHIKQSTDYVVTNPTYLPFAYTTAGGTVPIEIYDDDHWSNVISPGFNFCYYGNTFSSLLLGSNSAITFNTSLAGQGSGYAISATTGMIPNSAYAANMIFGPYHDIDPGLTSANKKIEWRVEGVAPKRRFIASYNDMPYFGSGCTTQRATHQMVLYEGTGVIEVYIKDKPFCTGWNSGLTILGVQNQTRTAAVAAAGKNATVWGQNAMDSCFRFTPWGGASRLKSAELVVNGNVVATADTSTFSAGLLNLNFPNVCPTADSTAYVLRVTYNHCIGDPPTDVIFTDTVFVKRVSSTTISVAKTDATCSTNGTITITANGGQPPYEYSINGGTNWQSSNTFTNVAPGTYSAVARVVGSNCPSAAQPVTITLANTLEMTVATVNANCTGGTITVNASSGNAPYQYSINNGGSYQASNVFNGVAAGTYIVVVRDAAGCTRSQQVTLTFTDNLVVSQSQQAAICAGQTFTSTFTGNAASYSWSPATGVSNTQALNPVFSPVVTTTYTLTATLGSCTQTRTVAINVTPGAVANAGPDAIVIANDPYQMQATGSVGTYLWTPSIGLSAANVLNPVATPAITTTYTLRVTTGQGCFAEDAMTLTVIPYCIKPMNAFTPNGDGINDLWLITNGNCLQNARAQVFNRYGAKVFEANDYKNTWNGTYEGKPLPDGTYYYIIDYTMLNGKKVYLKGNVTILR